MPLTQARFALQVTIVHVLKAVVTFRGLLIEGVIVRAFNELHTDDDGKVGNYAFSSFFLATFLEASIKAL